MGMLAAKSVFGPLLYEADRLLGHVSGCLIPSQPTSIFYPRGALLALVCGHLLSIRGPQHRGKFSHASSSL